MINNLEIKELKLFKRGKVRDIYDLGDKLLIIATDRISCFDSILPTLIPDKGKILTKVSLFWFSFLEDIVKNHLISVNPEDLPVGFENYKEKIIDRFMIIKKCEIVPFECVVRGYISGSGWEEYKTKNNVCGIELPLNLKESDKLEQPLFTPATKVESGHDENVSFDYMKDKIGESLANKIKEISIAIYNKAAKYAWEKGVIIADTKFEFGIYDGELILVDEVLTPDSSRFWPKSEYEPGRPQMSFDKQFVRGLEDAVVLIDDIDLIKSFQRYATKDDNISSAIDFQDMLEFLDGQYNMHRCIIILTTNDIDKVNKADTALFRPGRVDYRYTLNHCDETHILKILKEFFEVDVIPKKYDVMLESIGTRKITIANIMQTYLLPSLKDFTNRNEALAQTIEKIYNE